MGIWNVSTLGDISNKLNLHNRRADTDTQPAQFTPTSRLSSEHQIIPSCLHLIRAGDVLSVLCGCEWELFRETKRNTNDGNNDGHFCLHTNDGLADFLAYNFEHFPVVWGSAAAMTKNSVDTFLISSCKRWYKWARD